MNELRPVLKEASRGQTLQLKVGEEFDLELPENRTSGFRWQLLKSGEPVCTVLHQAFTPGGLRPGQAGVHQWRFRIGQAGTATIELSYRRPWEAAPQEAGTFAVSVSGRD